jgi:uncharacterized protein YacL
MILLILRVLFIAVSAGVATIFVGASKQGPSWLPYLIFSCVIVLALGVITVDIFTPKKRIEVISAVYFGLLIGFLMTYLVSIALTPLLEASALAGPVQMLVGVVLCYGCISLLLQTKDDFRFIIPYVEFARELKGFRPLVLDTSSIIDGQLIMPRFVIAELQAIADSSDRLRRARGRRGLDIMNRLRSNEKVDVQIFDRELPEFAGQPVDMKLVLLAKHLEGKVITGDFNLNKVAKIHNVPVVNLNEIAHTLRPQYLPGEVFQLRVVKNGELPEQGVGYLDDGTMVVVEGGRDRVGTSVSVVVTTTHQTQAGRMIFTKLEEMVRS